MAKTRNYSYRDVDMLTASQIVAVNFKSNIGELSTVRSD